MTAIFKQYGKTIIVIISILAILALLAIVHVNGRQGLTGAVAGTADFEDVDYSTFQDALALENYTALDTPEITYTSQPVSVGTPYDLEDVFFAEGTDGQPCKITIMDVLDETGNSLLYAAEEDKRNDVRLQPADAFVFERQGVYTIYVQAVDGNKRISSMKLKVPIVR